MKQIYLILLKAFTILFILNSHAGEISLTTKNLCGAYTNLPPELKSLSLINGAIALETKFLKHVYASEETDKIITKANLHLIQALFYQIPDTNDFGLSKKLFQNRTTQEIASLVKKIINNMVYRFFLEKIEKTYIEKPKGKEAQVYKKLIQKIKTNIVAIPPITKETFLAPSNDITRLAFLGSLWFIQKNIQNFNYEKQLQKTLLKASKTLLKTSFIPLKIEKTIKQINNNAQSIKIDQKISPLSKESKQKIETLLTLEKIETLNEYDYESLMRYLIKKLIGTDQHPQEIKDLRPASVTINEEYCSFPSCVEICLLNLINYLAFDKEKKQVSLKTLQKRFKNLREEVTEFYTKHEKNINKAFKENFDKINSDWSLLNCQIPHIKYRSNDICQIKANTANILIAINYLLGLNWQIPKKLSSIVETELSNFIALFEPYKNIHINNKIPNLTKNFFKEASSKFNTIEIDYEDFSIALEIKQLHCMLTYPAKFKIQSTISKKLYEQYPMLYFITSINKWPIFPKQKRYESFLPFFAHPIEEKSFVCSLENQLQHCSYFWIDRLIKLIEKQCPNNIQSAHQKILKTALKTIKDENISKEKQIGIVSKYLDSIMADLKSYTQSTLLGGGLFGQALIEEKFNTLEAIIKNYYSIDPKGIKRKVLVALENSSNSTYPLLPNEIKSLLRIINKLIDADEEDLVTRKFANQITKDILETKKNAFSMAKRSQTAKQSATQLLKRIAELSNRKTTKQNPPK